MVVCHPVADVARVNEERLMHCLRRLLGLVVSRRVLRGAGYVEAFCAERLQQLAGYYSVDFLVVSLAQALFLR